MSLEVRVEARRYAMAPLIRFTLISLYLALVLPLPVLATAQLQRALVLALPLGLVVVLAATSEQVQLDAHGIRVAHAPWCAWLWRRGWELPWSGVTGLTPVATSQGGRVYYVRSPQGAYLLPQRVAQFTDFLSQFQAASGIDTTAIGRISPAWTYQLLALLCGLMLAGEVTTAWAVATGRWDFPPGLGG